MAKQPQLSHASTNRCRRGSTATVELDANNILSGKRQRKESRKKAESSASEAENLPVQKKPRKNRREELMQEATPAISTQSKSTAPPTKVNNQVHISTTKKYQMQLQINSPLATTRKSSQYGTALATSREAEEPGYYSDDGIRQSAQRRNGMLSASKKLMTQEVFEDEGKGREMPLAQPSSAIDLTHENTNSSSSLESSDEEILPQTFEMEKELSKEDQLEKSVRRMQKVIESQENEDHLREYGLQPDQGRFRGFTLTQLESGLPVRYLVCGQY